MTEAFHDTDGEKHVVGIGDLRVLITKDGSTWNAQGMEIDFFTQGESIDAVKDNFAKGLSLLIGASIERTGALKDILRVAPSEEWAKLFSNTGQVESYGTLQLIEGLNALPFAQIDFYGERQAA